MTSLPSKRLLKLIQSLDIPDSHYQLATDRYNSIADWLNRPNSTIRQFKPWVYTQGSFRYGTVTRPIHANDEYDLDMVVELTALPKTILTQHEIKELVGNEIKAYAKTHGINSPVEEKHRCWRLEYADNVNFHIDILPAVPEDDRTKQLIARLCVDPRLAESAIAITDDRHLNYDNNLPERPTSNPNGYDFWFKGRMRSAAELLLKDTLLAEHHSSVDDVPTWRWKTPLQRIAQFLKRHRDIYFIHNKELSPISMIITTLAGHAYNGETDLYTSLKNVVELMPQYISKIHPRVPNPANPGDDFAERWANEPELENAFWRWHTQLKADIAILANDLNKNELLDFAERKLNTKVPAEDIQSLVKKTTTAATPSIITSATRPWGQV